MPAPPPKTFGSFMQWAGPAVVLGALSVGGFEAYQAGYVAAQKWTGIYWVYVVSCFFQLLMNNEIARYTIATGETVLQGFTRLHPAKFWGWATALFCVVAAGLAGLDRRRSGRRCGPLRHRSMAVRGHGRSGRGVLRLRRKQAGVQHAGKNHVRLLRGRNGRPGLPHRLHDELGRRARGELGLGGRWHDPGRHHPHRHRPVPEPAGRWILELLAHLLGAREGHGDGQVLRPRHWSHRAGRRGPPHRLHLRHRESAARSRSSAPGCG